MNKTLLKRTAMQSLALMLAVVTLSYALHQYQTVEISASDKTNSENTITSEEKSNTSEALIDVSENDVTASPPVNPDNESEGNPSASIFTGVLKDIDTNIINQMSDRYLIVKKPRGENIYFHLEDLYVTKSIQITLSGLTGEDMGSGVIGRVNKGELFTGDPVFTEIISPSEEISDNSTEPAVTTVPVITKDFGNDLIHGIKVTSVYDKATMLYTSTLLIELDSVYVHIMHEDKNYYYIDLRKPQEVYDRVLVIDAGHGDKDGGALSAGEQYYEKNINLDILLHLKALLDQEDIKVYYTRTGDDKVFLRPRVDLANAVDCDFFISIHNNANEITWPNGSEVLYCDTDFKGVKAKDLAEIMMEELGKTIPLKQNGVVQKKIDDIYIMEHAVVPAVLIEVGYMTNNSDMNFLSKVQNRQAIAQGIFNGIMRAYDELDETIVSQ